MEYDRREGGSSEIIAAKEAAKTKASWKEASKAAIEEETAGSDHQRRNHRSGHQRRKRESGFAKCETKELKT